MLALPDYTKPAQTYKKVLKPYGKKDLLKALTKYNKHNFVPSRTENRSFLYLKRDAYGTQFLIDLFILTEVYIKHFPKYSMHKCRADITYILNTNPNYRILYED